MTNYLSLLICAAALCFSSVVYAQLDLSLEDAIQWAIRDNPNVKRSRLNYTLQDASLKTAEWQFKPHYTLQADGTIAKTKTGDQSNTTHTYDFQPSVSLLTPIGTQLTLSETNNLFTSNQMGLSLQIMQPLLRGFGRPIVEAALYNARDSEKIARLQIEAALRNTITSVINAYLDVIIAKNTLHIDEEAVKRAEQSVTQTALFIKAGRKAGNELVIVKANAASAKAKVETDKALLKQSGYTLLTAIGINPNIDARFPTENITQLTQKYTTPDQEETKKQTLENDIQYQIDHITLHGTTKRALQSAENNLRWQLNFNANLATGSGLSGQQNAGGIQGLLNGQNQVEGFSLTLQIPLNDQQSKQALLSAKIALQEAEMALQQEKWEKETQAINNWNNLESAQRGLEFALQAEDLQQKTYHLSFQKYLHGLIDSLELQSAQMQLIQAEQAAVQSRVSYLKSLVNIDFLIGHTLKTWGVKIRLGEKANE